jgi:hypothetical protein
LVAESFPQTKSSPQKHVKGEGGRGEGGVSVRTKRAAMKTAHNDTELKTRKMRKKKKE